ncbi:MAG: hypothetical protein M1274_04400 [Actinobacteria bacterium]|nr:hypothetical protein [Actinomycetota bacterium]
MCKTRALIGRWSSRYLWQDRVRAWDALQDQLRQMQLIKNREQYASRQIRLGQTLQAKGLRRLVAVEPGDLSVSQAQRLVLEGMKLEERGLGLSTHTVRDDRGMSVNEVESLADALAAVVLSLLIYVPEGQRAAYRRDLERGFAAVLGLPGPAGAD